MTEPDDETEVEFYAPSLSICTRTPAGLAILTRLILIAAQRAFWRSSAALAVSGIWTA